MKILFLITGLGMGGAEQQVCLLADVLADMGHDIVLISLTGRTVVKPKNKTVKLIELNMQKSIVGFLGAYCKIRKIIKSEQTDVVHSHMFHANIMARLLRLSSKINKLACTAHSNNEGGKFRMAIYRYTNFLSDVNTNVSAKSVQAFVDKHAVKAGQMQTVYNGIDIVKFKPQENAILTSQSNAVDKGFVFIAVGRLTLAKDYPNLLNAVSILKNTCANFTVLIVGDGELKEQLQNLACQLGIDEHIQFLGVRNNIPALMNAADAFVLSSAWEGFGLVVAEAMACEKPVIATNCGGVAEVLGDNGYLLPPKNSQKLADAMLAVMQMTVEQRSAIGAKARQRVVDHFSINTIAQQWLAIYRN